VKAIPETDYLTHAPKVHVRPEDFHRLAVREHATLGGFQTVAFHWHNLND